MSNKDDLKNFPKELPNLKPKLDKLLETIENSNLTEKELEEINEQLSLMLDDLEDI